ncbi:lipopolysaccharide biosynthesis protein [Bowmanella yangjiangensis]|uniref:Lipopolysaccharide biosynthesis protein n=1 Tax=Bowmanella yangjiangensis TaxID=2811230 RepID=A0ABS3CVC6_9ALTE|nr:lipopolysaccharide biosynthesis protein [Bowmanella yangjiangensis]MBN7820376.1 lipopolysaccharide biosynthesis protein [Bowmanella yangjiangensis]
MTTTHSKVLSGAMLMIALRLAVKSMGMVSTIILARLLLPEDFGLIALVMSVYALLELINAFGFDVVLIQNQQATEEHYNTSWTLKVIFGFLACLMMLFAASPLADFYQDVRVEHLAYCLSGMFVINGLCNIGTVNFRKELNFKREFHFEFLVKLLAVTFTLIAAYLLRNYWALALGMLFNTVIRLLLSYTMSTYRPTFCLSKCKELYSFSSWLLLNNVLSYLNMKSKDLIIGKMAGVQYVGHYSIGDEFANLPSTEFVASVNRATFPGYAKVAHDRAELRALYLSVLSSIAMVGIPSSFGLALISPYFVPVILGENWLTTIPILHLLALASALICVNTNVGYVFMAIGKPKYTTGLLALRVTILLSLMVLFIGSSGYMGAAYAVLITSLLMFPLFTWAICRCLKLSLWDYLNVLLRPLVSAMVMYAGSSLIFFSSLIVPTETPSFLPTLWDLMQLTAAGLSIYIATHFLLWTIQGRPSGPEKYLVDKLSHSIRTRTAS